MTAIRGKWQMIGKPSKSEWDCQDAWEQLTDKQREYATQLHLEPEDMDARTFTIIQKAVRD